MRRSSLSRCLALLLSLALGRTLLAEGSPAALQVTVEGCGRPLLLIPGLGCSGEVWNGTVARLRDRHECHVVTLAGFAGVPAVPEPSLSAARAALVDYIARARLVQPIVIGHSLGGALALAIAAEVPDRVGGVVSVDGLPFLAALFDPAATAASARPQAEALRAFYTSASAAEVAARSRAAVAAMVRDPADLARVGAWTDASDPATLGALAADLFATDLRPEMGRVRAPILLVAAAPRGGDPALRARLLEAYARQVEAAPRRQVTMVERGGHFVMLDAPDELDPLIDRFLAEVSEESGR